MRGGQEALGVRFQAKKLFPGDVYEHLYGSPGRAQAEALVAGVRGTPLAALYCFYNFREPWPHPTTVPDAQFGCAVAPAHHVLQKLKAASANFSHVAPLQVPWRTLCAEARAGDGAASQSRGEKALDFIRGQIAELVGEEEAPEIVPSAEVPDYARAVMTNEGEFWQAQVPARRVVTTDFGGAAVRG